jgi:hypothetical protein
MDLKIENFTDDLLDSATKIEAVGRLHRLLLSAPADTSTIEIGAYLYEIADAAKSSLTDINGTEFSCDGHNIHDRKMREPRDEI